MALFESYERREKQILAVLEQYGIKSIEECADICKEKGFDPYTIVQGIQPICFENAKWAYTVGCAIAIKKGCTKAADAAAAIGEGLQSFCIPGSVADQRKVGLGHGNLGKMLLEEETECFAFLAGHESFAAAEGAIGIAEKANKVRQKPLRVILNGLGKDAAQIIARINGFTYVETEMDYYTGEVKEVFRKAYSEGLRSKVNCYGANDVTEGVAIMWKENVDVSITGNSTNPTRFQHPVAGTYKKERLEAGKKYFSVASGGGTGRTLHPDNWREGYRNIEKAVKAGKVKAIGLSNFPDELLKEAIDTMELKPQVVQVEAHPYYPQTELKKILAETGMGLMAWYPLGHGDKSLINEPVFAELAAKYKKTNAQIILRWHIQSGNVVIPGSKNPDHIRDNFDIFDFVLSDEDMAQIAKVNKNKRYYTATPDMLAAYATMELQPDL